MHSLQQFILPSSPQIRLSMCTANKLEGSLSALKRRLGLTFIKFEDAAVELEPFVRAHVFDTASYLGRQMLAHFKDVSFEINSNYGILI